MTTRHGAPTPRRPTLGSRTPRTAPCCRTPCHALPHTMCTMPPPPRIAPRHHTPRHAPRHAVTQPVERPRTAHCPTPRRSLSGGHTPRTTPHRRTPRRALRHDATRHVERPRTACCPTPRRSSLGGCTPRTAPHLPHRKPCHAPP